MLGLRLSRQKALDITALMSTYRTNVNNRSFKRKLIDNEVKCTGFDSLHTAPGRNLPCTRTLGLKKCSHCGRLRCNHCRIELGDFSILCYCANKYERFCNNGAMQQCHQSRLDYHSKEKNINMPIIHDLYFHLLLINTDKAWYPHAPSFIQLLPKDVCQMVGQYLLKAPNIFACPICREIPIEYEHIFFPWGTELARCKNCMPPELLYVPDTLTTTTVMTQRMHSLDPTIACPLIKIELAPDTLPPAITSSDDEEDNDAHS
jgi:hypothetical protein